jgi:hypothetical protein
LEKGRRFPGGHQIGNSVEVSGIYPDMKIRTHLVRYFGFEEAPYGLASDSPHYLAYEIPLGDGVVATMSARFPPTGLSRQVRTATFPIIQFLVADRPAETGQPCRVAKKVFHHHGFLAVSGKFRPVFGDWGTQIELTSVGQHQGAQKGHGLGGGKHIDDGVLLPGPQALRVLVAAPDIDHEFTLQSGRKTSANIAALAEVFRKGFAHSRETLVTISVNVHRRVHLSAWAQLGPTPNYRSFVGGSRLHQKAGRDIRRATRRQY